MIYLAILILFPVILFYLYKSSRKTILKLRVFSLLKPKEHINKDTSEIQNLYTKDNFNESIEKQIFPSYFYILAVLTSSFFVLLLTYKYFNISILSVLISLVVSLYLGLLLALFVKKYLKDRAEREVLLQTPLMLESLILLVESGLGIIPAIEKLISQHTKLGRTRGIPFLHLREVYRLSSRGFTFSEAVKSVSEKTNFKVLRHCLIHLDCSQSEGGRLVPSLINLANYSHTEWKLNSEAKVRRLENLVVFPVFISVIGLMLLTAAAPLVPLFEFSEMNTNINMNKVFNKQSTHGVLNDK